MGREEGGDALFESKGAKGRMAYKLFSGSVFVGICLIWVYRATHVPGAGEKGRWVWMGVFVAELCFGLYWVLSQSVRWSPVYHRTFKERLSQRYGNELPPVDIFICTANHTIEPPMLVVNTVLSVMAYDYPQEKLSIYVSDDGGSELIFYALLEATDFSKHWIPFCKRYSVEPRSPAAYFSSSPYLHGLGDANELLAIKKLYIEMENKIKATQMLGRIPSDVSRQHKGFSEWDSQTMPDSHQAIVQILIDGRDQKIKDVEGAALPSLIYLSREKRPQYPHNFKAGAMNALIRVSSEISNSPIILNVDCDMRSNSSQSVRDAVCFFMDKDKGHEIGYVQFPQNFSDLDKNNTYGDYISIVNEVELPGYAEALYIGTGCFHRRVSLCGKRYSKDCSKSWNKDYKINLEESTSILEERAKNLASCIYERNTGWGKDVGLMYGFLVEDIITGFVIQCKGWKSIYFNPPRVGFLGVAPASLGQILVQHQRWSEGLFNIFLSKYNPFLYGHGKIKLKLQMSYAFYMLWAPMSLPTLYYVIIPSICLLKGIPLFPKISSLWFIVFAYVIGTAQMYSLVEALWCGQTLRSWWNMQRMKIMRRISSHFFSLIDIVLQALGLGKSRFNITAKVADHDALERYRNGLMEFGSSSPMFMVLATVAMLTLLCLLGGVIRMTVAEGFGGTEQMTLQFLLCGLLLMFCVPIYHGMFLRKDKGSIPASLALESFLVAASACLVPLH